MPSSSQLSSGLSNNSTNAASSTPPSHSPSVGPTIRPNPIRSNPIAIRRNRGSSNCDTSDSDDDSDGSAVNVELDALKLSMSRNNVLDGTTSHSLPSRLLRAPMLSSMPSNDDSIAYQNMLPPAMTLGATSSTSAGTPHGGTASLAAFAGKLNGVETQGVAAYGSLRESHMQGRFIDGPSSYRDKQSGDIRRLQYRVRFQEFSDSSVSSSLPQSLSIGERLHRARQRQGSESTTANRQPQPTSTLAAMLEGSHLEDEPDTAPTGATERNDGLHESRNLADYDESELYGDRSNMLSTSLTALEVLQSVLRPRDGERTASTTSGGTLSNDFDQLPRDSMGNNALLSRSLSDPTPQLRRLATSPPSVSGVNQSPLLRGIPTLTLSAVAESQRISGTFLSPASNVSSSLLSTDRSNLNSFPPLPPSSQNLPAAHHPTAPPSPLPATYILPPSPSVDEEEIPDPDVEGAFEMDFE